MGLSPLERDQRNAQINQSREMLDQINALEEQIALAESGVSIQEDELSALNRIATEIEDQNRRQQQQALADFIQSSGLRATDVFSSITTGNYDGFSEEHKAQLNLLGFPVDDFIYQSTSSGSRITPIHSEDQFYGAKPGGPIANASNNSQSVVVNIYGASTSDVVRTMDTYLNAKGIRANRPLGRKM
jgi:hypothetical protein